MSQSRQSDRSDGKKLAFRIVGRKKEYEVDKVVGETKDALGRRVAEAINKHSRSLNDHAVCVQASDIDYIKVMIPGKNNGPNVNRVEEDHTFLSVKLTPLGHTKLVHTGTEKGGAAKGGAVSPSGSQGSGTGRRSSRAEPESPSGANRTIRRHRTEIDQGEDEFRSPDPGKKAKQDTISFAISVFEMASKQVMRDIRGGQYPSEVLDDVDLIASGVKEEIAAARGKAARIQGEGDIVDEESGQRSNIPKESGEQGGWTTVEKGGRPSGQVDTERTEPLLEHPRSLLLSEQASFWKELCEFLGCDPRRAGADSHKVGLLPVIYGIIAEEIGGFYNFVAEEQASNAKLAETVPELDPKDAITLYKKYLFHWERSRASADLPKEEILRIDPYNLGGPEIVDLNLKPPKGHTDLSAVLGAPVVLLRNCKIGSEEEVMKHFQSAPLKDKQLTSKLQDPKFTGLPVYDPSSELEGDREMKLQDFIRGYYTEEEKAEHVPNMTFYGIGLRIEDHKLLKELDAELGRHKLSGASPISGVISELTRKRLNPTYRGINLPEVLIKLNGAWTGGTR